MATQLAQVEPAPRAPLCARRAMRLAVVVDRATVRRHGETPVEAALVDLSVYGCRLETVADLEEDARVWIRLDGALPVAATVVWQADGRAGCRFDTPIPTALFRTLTRAAA
jgi:hypothetical protein